MLMRKGIGVLVAAFFYYSGLVGLSRWLMRNSGRRLILLNYHQASGGDLQRHLLYLRRHYRMLHLEEALDELYAAYPAQKWGQDRRTRLVLTFDDGYHDNYTHAFALARKLRVPITIFLIPGYVESGDYFWWDEGPRLVRRATVKVIRIGESIYNLTKPDQRALLEQHIDACLRHSTSVAAREVTLQEFRSLLGVPIDVTQEERGRQPLTWKEICEMLESGWISFGAHTMHHPILAYLANSAEVQSEVITCRHMLEVRLGYPVRAFAYPVGRSEHIGEQAVQAVKSAGYDWAVTTLHGVNTPASDPYQLRRVLGDVGRHWLVMAAETSGIWHFFAPCWKAVIGKGESV